MHPRQHGRPDGVAGDKGENQMTNLAHGGFLFKSPTRGYSSTIHGGLKNIFLFRVAASGMRLGSFKITSIFDSSDKVDLILFRSP